MSKWLFLLQSRFWVQVARTVFGEIHFSPPTWPVAVFDSMRKHPGRWALPIVTGGLLYGAGMKGYEWWDQHRPRPRVVVEERWLKLDLLKPGYPTKNEDGKFVPGTLTVTFSGSAAKLDQINKPITSGFEITPHIDGAWRWVSDSRAVFTPATNWPAGTSCVVAVSSDALASGVKLPPVSKQIFTTPSLEAKWEEVAFYTNPKAPSEHFITAAVETTLPVTLTELESSLDLRVITGENLFAKDGGAKPFTVTQDDEGGPNRYLFKSARIAVPQEEQFVELTLAKGMKAEFGGEGVTTDQVTKVRVPDVSSGFKVEGVSTSIIDNAEGEPEQMLFVETSGFALTEELAKSLQAWFLDLPEDKEDLKAWTADGDLNPAVAAYAKPIALKPVESGSEDEEAAWSTRHAFKFLQEKPGQILVRVAKGTKGLGGFVLARNYASVTDAPEFQKEAALLGQGGLLALNGERKVSIKTRGIKHLRVTLGRVPAAQVNHLAVFNEGTFESPSLYGMSADNIAHFHREVLPVPAKNDYQAAYISYDFSAAISRADASDPDASRGMYFVEVEGVRERTKDDDADEEDQSDETLAKWVSLDSAQDERFILVTDLGIIAKRNSIGTRDIFVQSISQAGPAAGVAITVLAKNGEILATATTDVQGHASLPDVEKLKRERKPVVITARLGNDVAFMPFRDETRQLELSRFDTDGLLAEEMEELEAFVFAERGVYRPGDGVHLSAIVRRRDWGGTLGGMPVEFTIYDAKDREVKRERLTLSADGFIDWHPKLAETDPTGVYQAYLCRVLPKDEVERIGRTAFRVEDFEPDRLKITAKLSSPPGLAWIAPKDVKATLRLENLFGNPAAQNKVTAELDMSPTQFSFEAFPDHQFYNRTSTNKDADADEESVRAGKHVDLGEQTTAADGTAVFDLALERFAGGSFAMRVSAEGFEKDSGRSVRTATSALVSAMPYAVGFRTRDQLDYLGKDKPAAVQWICIGPDLKQMSSPALKARLIQARFVSVLTRQKNDTYKYVSTRREKLVSETNVTLPATGMDYVLPTTEPGEYRLELADGDALVSVIHFTVVGKGDPGRSLDRDAELELKLARRDWNSNEALEMHLNAPYTGAGLITIERENVMAWQWFKSPTTSSTQTILVPPGLDGTGYVNVAFVRALDSPEIFTSPLSYAVQPFDANKDRHRLEVTLDSIPKARPGDVLHIGYKAAAPGRAVIYAVDEGILQITDYKVPKPLSHFMQKRAMETDTWQLLDLILPEFSIISKQSAFGGDGEDALNVNLNPFQRKREAPVVYWSGIVETGPERKEVSFKVPDYFYGKLRVMAVAVTPDRMGSTETQSTIRGPMVLTPNAPTFAVPGDEFAVSLTVANNIDTPNAPNEVKIHAISSEQVELLDAADVILPVAPTQEATARFRVRAKDNLGGADLTFTATAGAETVQRHVTLSVRPASPFTTEVQSGYFRQASYDVKLNRSVYPHFRKAEAVVSALPLGLARGLDSYLADYPHGCSEQITSRAMSRLLLSSEVDFGFDQAESAKQLSDAIRLLASRQNSDGGFGYWSGYGTSPANDFLSVYVSLFLTEAKDAGHTPPAGMMDGAMHHMKDIARGEKDHDVRAAAIYLLTRNGQVTSNFALNLRDTLEREQKDKWQGTLAGAFLGGTYALLQQKGEADKLLRAWWAQTDHKPQLTRWNGYWYDDGRISQSLGLAVLCRHLPELAKTFGYDDITMITEPIRAGSFNTITAACGTLALKSWSKVVAQADLKLAIYGSPATGAAAMLQPEGSGIRKTLFDAGTKALSFRLNQNGSDLGAFYQVTESGFDKAGLEKPISEGMEIIRELTDESGKPVTSAKVGETLNVVIRVRNISPDPLNEVALLDLFPGGFLPVQGGLSPGKDALAGAEYVDVREDRAVIYTDLAKGETKTFTYEIKPVASGTFAVPPVFAECMYDRGIHGRNSAGKVEVK